MEKIDFDKEGACREKFYSLSLNKDKNIVNVRGGWVFKRE